MKKEEWKEVIVKGQEYKVSSYGKIIGKRGRLLKTRIDEDGYIKITLGKDGFSRCPIRVHRIVAEALIPKTNDYENFEVNHKDFNRQNNHVDNLEWVTHRDNIKYSYENNTEAQYVARDGIKNGRATFQDKDIIEIRRLYNIEHLSIAKISRFFKSPESTISNIVHNQTWKHLL